MRLALARRAARLWRAAYLWACDRYTYAGHAGLRPPHHREPLPASIRRLRIVGAAVAVATTPLIVGGVYGLITLPDVWSHTVGALWNAGFTTWFLPALMRRPTHPIEPEES
jgi:hypothetical protein